MASLPAGDANVAGLQRVEELKNMRATNATNDRYSRNSFFPPLADPDVSRTIRASYSLRARAGQLKDGVLGRLQTVAGGRFPTAGALSNTFYSTSVLQAQPQIAVNQLRLLRINHINKGHTTNYWVWVSPLDTVGEVGKTWMHAMRGEGDARSLAIVPPFLCLGSIMLLWHLTLDNAGVHDGVLLEVRGAFGLACVKRFSTHFTADEKSQECASVIQSIGSFATCDYFVPLSKPNSLLDVDRSVHSPSAHTHTHPQI